MAKCFLRGHCEPNSTVITCLLYKWENHPISSLTVILLFCYFLIKGKDRIIFVTKEDHETPSNAELIADDPNDPYEEQGY